MIDPTAKDGLRNAEFHYDRLLAARPNLQLHLGPARAIEARERWVTDYSAVKDRRDKLAAEFAKLYPKMTAQLVDLFERMKALEGGCRSRQSHGA